MRIQSIIKHILTGSLFIVVIVLIAEIVALISKPSGNILYIPCIGSIAPSIPILTAHISPPGYPQAGGFWKINVYIQNRTIVYQPVPNATVIVTVESEGRSKTYEFRVDDNGEASFQFLPEYKNIAFQAYYSGISSEKVILTTTYVSAEIVDTLLVFNVFSVLGSLASDLLYKPKRNAKLAVWIKLTKWMLICIFCIFSFVTLTCISLKVFQNTAWGFPENIIGSYITFTFLKYIFFAGVVLFFGYWIVRLTIRGIETKPFEPN